MAKIIVQNTEITVSNVNGEDYICITDMLKAKDGDFFVTDWLRNRNTMEFLGVWERIYNPNFNYGEFATIRNQAGLNSFKISVKEFVARTGAISLQAKAGRYGGTYAHKDIAFEFAMWISPEFKVYVVREFQRLKADEQRQLAWSAKRELSKINYRIHTDAIKSNLIPAEVTREQAAMKYAEEALCFGWIDSTLKRLPDSRLAQRLSPRRKGSHWTELNRQRCRDLEARGLMTEAGRKAL